MNRSLCSAVVLSAVTIVFGTSTARADDAADPGPPPVNCTQPEGSVPLKAPKAEMARWQQRIDDYKLCMNTYSATNITKAKELQSQAQNFQTQALASQAQAQAYQARAQTYATAANGAADTFNAYVGALNAQVEAAQKK